MPILTGASSPRVWFAAFPSRSRSRHRGLDPLTCAAQACARGGRIMCERCRPSRRSILARAGAFAALGALPLARARAEQPAGLTLPPNAIPPADALDRLKQGN